MMKITEEDGTESEYPLTFICQIDCEDIAPFDKEGLLPHEGMLYFFAAIDEFIGYDSPEHFPLGRWPKKAVKDIPVFTASGNTEDGEDAYRAIVTIVQGDKINGIGWDYSLDDPKQCAEVSVTDVSVRFRGRFGGEHIPVWRDAYFSRRDRGGASSVLCGHHKGEEGRLPFVRQHQDAQRQARVQFPEPFHQGDRHQVHRQPS